MFFPRRGVRLPAVSQSISTSGCCPLVRVGTATRPRNVRCVACSPGKGERHRLYIGNSFKSRSLSAVRFRPWPLNSAQRSVFCRRGWGFLLLCCAQCSIFKTSKTMKIYISGAITDPTTGKPRENFAEAFNSAADYLRSLGHEPVNPADPALQSKAGGTQWVDYIARDVKLVSECDGIYFIAGANASDGSHIERIVAEHLRIPSYFPHLPPPPVEKAEKPKAAEAKK